MDWIAFFIGVAAFIFVVLKKTNGLSAPQISAMLFFPTALILASVFAPNITDLKFGPQGVEFSLELAKKAATEVVKKDPAFAEALTAKKGSEALAAARERISTVKSWGDLERIMPFDLKNGSIVFYPKVNDKQVPVEVNPKAKDSEPSFSVDVLSKDNDWKQIPAQEPRKPEKRY